ARYHRGEDNEEAWASAGNTTPFINKWPSDTGFAAAATDVRMLFDDRFIYVLPETSSHATSLPFRR
ncbi:MAG: hypothetical protein HC859_13900, partial [Bacteroidia bacterium]|nr:hypothetical protein [Bacteroidia bacterium]